MAKQTFTTGSVLTAAQMNSLQANDYNWTVSQKTASYVLVAADAGTRIEMNAAGATTVTVNTGLFSAGDTLFIQNIGAGACTVTAGTATVNKATAGSLTLSQYQGGTLYFVSASSAIFFADAGYTPPLTTKGDLFGYDTAAARIPIGSNNQVLTADSTQALGLKWATPSSGSLTQLATGSLSGTSLVISGFSSSYTDLVLKIYDAYASSGSTSDNIQVNSVSSYDRLLLKITSTAVTNDTGQSRVSSGLTVASSAATNYYEYTFTNYASTVFRKPIFSNVYFPALGGSGFGFAYPALAATSTITSITFTLTSAGTPQTLSGGTYVLYGRN